MLYQIKKTFFSFILIFLSLQTKAETFPKISEIARYDQGIARFNLQQTGFLGSLGFSEHYDPLDLNLGHYTLKEDSECGNFAVSLIRGYIPLKDPKIQDIENRSKNGDLEASCKMVFIEAKRYNFHSFMDYLKDTALKQHPLIMALQANHYLNNFSIKARKNGQKWALSESESLYKQACDLKSVYACSQLLVYYYSFQKKTDQFQEKIKTVLKKAKKANQISPFLYAAYLYSLSSEEKDHEISKRFLNYVFKKDPSTIQIINEMSVYRVNLLEKNPVLKPKALEVLKFWVDKAREQSFYGASYFQSLYELHHTGDRKKALAFLNEASENGYMPAIIDQTAYLILVEKDQTDSLVQQFQGLYSKEPRALLSVLNKIKNNLKSDILRLVFFTQKHKEDEVQKLQEFKDSVENLSNTYEFWMKKGAKMGDLYSLRALASFYQNKDENKKAKRLFEFIKAKHRLSPKDLLNLSALYFLENKDEEAKTSLKKCTQSIYPPCIMEFLNAYHDEISTKEREYLLSLAAILGNTEAFFPLSLSFSKIKDKKNAFSWFQAASRHEPSLAMEAYNIPLNLGEKDLAISLLEESKDFLIKQQGDGSKHTEKIQEIEDKIQEIRGN